MPPVNLGLASQIWLLTRKSNSGSHAPREKTAIDILFPTTA